MADKGVLQKTYTEIKPERGGGAAGREGSREREGRGGRERGRGEIS